MLLLLYGLFKLIKATVFEIQFFDKTGYFPFLIAGLVMLLFFEERLWVKRLYCWGIILDILASLMTHYDTQNIYALPAILATLIMFLGLKCFATTTWMKIGAYVYVVVMLLFEIFARDIILLSNNKHGGETIFNQDLYLIEQGPAKGEWAREVDKEKYDEIYLWITANINEPTKVCYFGKNVLLYMMSSDIQVAVPQLFMDYASDDVLRNYYKKHPEDMPDLVILDVSPSTKRQISEQESKLFEGYETIYESDNYLIYEY